MSRYIDADLIQYTKQYYSTTLRGEYTLNTSKNHIDAIPTADVQEIKHGHWVVKDKSDYNVYCSNCGAVEEVFFEDGQTVKPSEYHYCWNCGAKMDEE